MMHKIAFVLTLFTVLGGYSAWAQNETSGATKAKSKEILRGTLRDETFSFKPVAGLLAYQDSTGDKTERLAAGFTMDFNLVSLVNPNLTSWYIGPATGLTFSHLGNPTSDFWGSNSSTNFGQASSNMFQIPTDLKLGYAVSDHVRISAHGGGNVVYRTIASSVDLGTGSDSSGTLWKYYPNVGADLDFAVGTGVGIVLRPDWTITSGNTLFTGTLGVGIFMG